MIPGSANPLLLAADAAAGAYSIPRSLRFNAPDSSFLSRTPASAGNRKKWTWAGWVKRTNLSDGALFHSPNTTSGTAHTWCNFSGDTLNFYDYTGSAYNFLRQTSQVFRDPSAWYHLVFVVDSDNGTASSRARIFVNGVEVTTWASTSTAASGFSTAWNNNTLHQISSQTQYLNAYLADIWFLDGLTPATTTRTVNGVTETILTDFGEFDATTGVWNPKAYTGSVSGNSFHLDFADNSNNTASTLGKDTSGNGNNWTPVNLQAGPNGTDSWSGIFDGGANYLSLSSAAALSGTGNFTLECWIKPIAYSGQDNCIYETRGGSGWVLFINSSGYLQAYDTTGSLSSASTQIVSLNVWQHIAFVQHSNTYKFFINGTLCGSFASGGFSAATALRIGTRSDGTNSFRGLISNFRTVSGTAIYTASFTVPSSPLTSVSGTTLLTLQNSTFLDNSANSYSITANGTARVSALSPFEPNEQTDSLVDSPTNGSASSGGDAGGTVVGNYATLNPLQATNSTLTDGNLRATSSSGLAITQATFGISSGKWYWEWLIVTEQNASYSTPRFGVCTANLKPGDNDNTSSEAWTVFSYIGGLSTSSNGTGNVGTLTGPPANWSNNDLVMIAVDYDAGKLWMGRNGTWFNGWNAVSGTNFVFNNLSLTKILFPFTHVAGGAVVYANFGARPFAYAAPAGFKSLNTANLPTSTILKGSDYFDTKLYTGNGSTQTISGLAFSPDLVWIKKRSAAADHNLVDSVRVGTRPYLLYPNLTNAENTTYANSVQSLDTTGFTVGSDSDVNASSASISAWCWDAGTSTVSNTAGSITSTVRANASAGFSIVTYTGNGTAGATVGHGLGAAPSMIIVKSRDATAGYLNWGVYHSAIGNTNALYLNTTAAQSTDINEWNNTSPTSTVFTLGFSSGNGHNINNQKYVCYCFSPVSGYSSAFSYTGNASVDGPMVNLGFRPRLILYKNATTAGTNWILVDTARDTYNVLTAGLRPNLSNAEAAPDTMDILSNGFKMRDSGQQGNASGATIIGFAWAENPFSIARAR